MKSTLYTTATAALLLGTASSAWAEVKPIKVTSDDSAFRLTFSGQLNRGILLTDDGEDTDAFFVDNDNSSTRFRLNGEADVGSLTAGFVVEIQTESNSTASVNQNTQSVSLEFDPRKLEIFLAGNFGTLYLGQGQTASDGTSEQDLSGTTVVGYSGVADFAGGLLLRQADGTLTAINVGSVFANFDGQSRRDRVRYDTNKFGGFSLSAGFNDNEGGDIALRYAETLGSVKLAAALAYSRTDTLSRVNGSISGLHEPSGLSLTLAAGRDDLDAGGRDPEFGYLKVGYQTDKISKWGKTAFSVDYYDGSDIASLNDSSESYGLQVVQNIEKINTELYAGFRTYSYENGGPALNDLDAVLVGARFKF
ncbi:porin [Ascidiaceihabitans sp.]|uniref:porin n=1 Tax=Ascidiaceihabitans sp. TaxID=1872644 RepID=UPI003299CA13